MDYFDTRYMNKNKWTDKAQSIFNDEIIHTECPQMCKINRGIILPQKDGVLPWGIGGCLNENKELVKTSTVSGAYGAKYAYDEQSLEYIDETVILIPIIPKQWGHFIIDVVSRLWFALEDEYSNYKIYYCAWGFEEGKLAGNYKKYLDYLGIFERMIYVSHPIQAKEVLIPEYTMSFADTCNEHFKDVNDVVVEKIMECEVVKTLQRYDKVYFSRTKLPTSKLKEIGELAIEKSMREAGFTILYPEILSLEEQVFYFQTSKTVASLSGTIMHNIIFSNINTQLFIMNRTCMPNHPQLKLNKLYSNRVLFIDAYSKRTLKHPKDYGSGPFLLEANDNLKKFLKDEFAVTLKTNYKLGLTDLFKYYISLIIFNLKYNKVTKFVYYQLKK